MREQGVSTVEIATMAGLWVPNFLMPFAYYRAFKKGAQHWTELSRMLNHLPFALSKGTEEDILILQQNDTHTHTHTHTHTPNFLIFPQSRQES